MPGDLVSVVAEDRYAVLKILAVDDGGVHARLYVERFADRPGAAELQKLSVAPFGPEHENPFSFGHLPLTYSSYLAWEPETIVHTTVGHEELVGYRIWKEADGGYF